MFDIRQVFPRVTEGIRKPFIDITDISRRVYQGHGQRRLLHQTSEALFPFPQFLFRFQMIGDIFFHGHKTDDLACFFVNR